MLSSIDISSDASFVCAGFTDSSIRVWCLVQAQQNQTNPESPDGVTVLSHLFILSLCPFNNMGFYILYNCVNKEIDIFLKY